MDVIKKNKVIKASKVAIPVLFALGLFTSNSVLAAGFTAAPPVGNLGNVIIDPYGNSPLTASKAKKLVMLLSPFMVKVIKG